MSTAPVEAWEFRLRLDGGIDRAARAGAQAPLAVGQVRLRFIAGGICGSDIGALAGVDTYDAMSSAGIAPMHEVVAEVLESRDPRLPAGQNVVGTALTGLTSELVEDGSRLIPVPQGFQPSDAVAIQPIGTVLRAIDTMPPLPGLDVVVVGAGAIGLAFIHALKSSGARRVVAVDPVREREGLARHYGADDFVAASGQEWSTGTGHAARNDRPAVIVDAVGRQPDIISGALFAVADGGFVLGFGSAADGDYRIPFAEMYHRSLTLASGRTRSNWIAVLERGAQYLRLHRRAFDGYISHRFPVGDAVQAYDLCSRPDATRIKVVVEADEGRGRV